MVSRRSVEFFALSEKSEKDAGKIVLSQTKGVKAGLVDYPKDGGQIDTNIMVKTLELGSEGARKGKTKWRPKYEKDHKFGLKVKDIEQIERNGNGITDNRGPGTQGRVSCGPLDHKKGREGKMSETKWLPIFDDNRSWRGSGAIWGNRAVHIDDSMHREPVKMNIFTKNVDKVNLELNVAKPGK